ncbi:hypothetical protein FB45DRAFT_873437 [Roridomyces roridus]|uniref:Uncharacterized protein n=1 Tax=Roridomyces roridus TaxID=1738132 RepID=A0AAD7FEC5_9AGAR|nr:hypothetical protein FB45DRAFT_873437 [Roridomyces roridus]
MWPRAWPWFHFVHVHRDLLLGLGTDILPSEKFLYLDFIGFVDAVRGDSQTEKLIATTPGFWACLVKSWGFLPQIDNPDVRKKLMYTIADFLGGRSARPGRSQFEEMVEAAGSVDRLAFLLVLFLRATIHGPPLEPSLSVAYIDKLLLFIMNATDCEPLSLGQRRAPRASLLVSLRAQDFSGELHVPVAIDSCLTLVEHMLLEISAKVWLPKLIHRGLLRALALITLECGRQRFVSGRVNLDRQVRLFLHQVLPAGMVFYHSASAIKASYDDVIGVVARGDFEQSCDGTSVLIHSPAVAIYFSRFR